MTPDMINALFEFSGGLFILNHCRAVLKHKTVAGVSVISVIFFTLWGIWNLVYYPHLNQMLSFYAGIFITVANTLWIALMVYYKRKT